MLNKIIKLLMSRVSTITLLILLQMGFLVGMVYYLSDMLMPVYIMLQIMSIIVTVWLVSQQDNPAYKMTWVIMILSLPVFGGLFYLLWGNKRLPLAMNLKLARHESPINTVPPDEKLLPRLWEDDPALASQAHYITCNGDFYLWEDTAVKFYPLGDDSFPDMLKALEGAERFILMEFFIINFGELWDEILEVLISKARSGVRVMLMYDDMGTIQHLPRNYANSLRELGIEVTVFNPYRPHLNMAMNNRDHRKIVVVDGNVGFCGGANISDEYINRFERFGHWKDTGVRISGRGVWSLTAMFLSLWGFENDVKIEDPHSFAPTMSFDTDGLVQPFSDTPLDRRSLAKDIYLNMISRATRYLYVTTPYLILDHEMVRALSRAAESGVDVRVITPHIPDKWYVHAVSRTHYERLIEAGVRVYEYLPGFIHAKQMVSDDKICVVGTTNMDYRSFYLHYECGIVFYNSSICSVVRDDVLDTLDTCIEITAEAARAIPLGQRIIAAVIKIFEPLL